jgi:hypothetical protein
MSPFDELQKNVLSEMGFENEIQEYNQAQLPEFVFFLLGIHPSTAELAIGKVGKRLIEFINAADLNHPDLAYIVDDIFNHNGDFRQQVQEVLDLADRCKHLSNISSSFYKLIDRSKFSKTFLHRTPIRVYKSLKDRDAIRRNRKMQNVNIVYKESEVWNSQPTSFQSFNRHAMTYLEAIELAERKLDRYTEVGCETIADKITKEIRQLRINLSYKYCGFNRITMTAAVTILAKAHGFKLRKTWDIHGNQLVKVIVPPNLIQNFQPDETDLPAMFVPTHIEDYHYEPRIYPISQMLAHAPEDMTRLVDHLDHFPDMNGKALFDDLLVLVPSISLHNYNGTYFTKTKGGNVLGFNKMEEAAAYLDKTLIEGGIIQPILLGERDGVCYFVAYWR